MNEAVVIGLMREALTTSLLVGAPILATTLVIGVVVSLIQAVTQVNEATLTFVPKLIGVFVAMLIFGPWMMETLLSFSAGLSQTPRATGAEMEAFALSPELTYTFFLMLLRTSSMLVAAPLLSHKGIPAYTKIGFAIFFSLCSCRCRRTPRRLHRPRSRRSLTTQRERSSSGLHWAW